MPKPVLAVKTFAMRSPHYINDLRLRHPKLNAKNSVAGNRWPVGYCNENYKGE